MSLRAAIYGEGASAEAFACEAIGCPNVGELMWTKSGRRIRVCPGHRKALADAGELADGPPALVRIKVCRVGDPITSRAMEASGVSGRGHSESTSDGTPAAPATVVGESPAGGAPAPDPSGGAEPDLSVPEHVSGDEPGTPDAGAIEDGGQASAAGDSSPALDHTLSGVRMSKICVIPECGKKVNCWDLCSMHVIRAQKLGLDERAKKRDPTVYAELDARWVARELEKGPPKEPQPRGVVSEVEPNTELRVVALLRGLVEVPAEASTFDVVAAVKRLVVDSNTEAARARNQLLEVRGEVEALAKAGEAVSTDLLRAEAALRAIAQVPEGMAMSPKALVDQACARASETERQVKGWVDHVHGLRQQFGGAPEQPVQDPELAVAECWEAQRAAAKMALDAVQAAGAKVRAELLAIAGLNPEETWFDSVIIEVAQQRVRSLYEQATELLAIRGLLNVPGSTSTLKAVEDLFDNHQAVTFEEEDLRRRVELLDKARALRSDALRVEVAHG